MIERERKYRLTPADADALEARVARLGRSLGRERQETVVFADNVGVLPKGTLIRYREVDGRRELTVKGKKTQKGLDKTRQEWNVALGDGPIFDLLGALRLKPGTRYVKDASRYEVNGVIVSVDRLDGLGAFCEIEAHDTSSDIDAVAKLLALDPAWFEPRGYPSIAAEAAATRPRSNGDASLTPKAGNGRSPKA